MTCNKEQLGKGEGYDGEIEDLAEQADFPGLDAEHLVEARALPPHGGQIILQDDESAPADPSAHQPVGGGESQQQEDPRAGVNKKPQ